MSKLVTLTDLIKTYTNSYHSLLEVPSTRFIYDIIGDNSNKLHYVTGKELAFLIQKRKSFNPETLEFYRNGL